MSRSQPAESRSNRSNCRIRSSGSTHREIALDCDTLLRSTSEKFSQGEHMRVHPRKHHHSRRRTLPLHGTHDKSLQSIMKCYDDIHQNLHDGVMSPNDADALRGTGERMMKVRNAV